MNRILELVRAGAGSGKTTNLCSTVAEAVAGGVDPARVLATTFTKKAAAELKGRIQAQLLSDTTDKVLAHQLADRLELAAIGTVHSVAHQLLRRYAVELGLSPRLEVLTEVTSQLALRNLLATMPVSEWKDLADAAEKIAVDELHERILKLLSCKRGNSIEEHAFRSQLKASADRLCQLLANDGPAESAPPVDQLRNLARNAIRDIEALDDTTQVTQKALEKLRQIENGNQPFWGSHVDAQKIKAGITSGANAVLDDIRTFAAQVRQNPNLHADIQNFVSLLTDETLRLEAAYVNFKAERGLVDFDDLETLLLDFLENERMVEQLAEDFDLILVDEFQDTNPLQLAIFQRLRPLAPRSRWVGDPKQAIYGFRDTDPELVNDVWENALQAERTELPHNYRSRKGLVQLVGELFTPIFGAEARQVPKNESSPRGVERWLLSSKNRPQDAMSIACGIAKLGQEEVRYGDIVILERTHVLLQTISEALDELGIPYLMSSPGLFSTREGALLLAGLRLTADRRDSLAAATIVHLTSDPNEETPEWLSTRLQALQDADEDTPRPLPWEGDARFAPLEQIRRMAMSPVLVTQQVIESLSLPSLVQKWGDPAQRSSNLDSTLKLAGDYEETTLASGQAATLSGLILYLEQLASNGTDMRTPPQGHDAVTLMTYHAAKGLEWPVVVLGLLSNERSADMWSPVVTGGGKGDDNPLAGRELRYWSWPFGNSGGQFGGRRSGSGLEDDALASPEGQEKSQREELENLRLLYVGCTRAKQKLVFAHRATKYDWLNKLPTVDDLLDPTLDDGEYEIDGIDTTLVIRRLEAGMAESCRVDRGTNERWITQETVTVPEAYANRYYSPSQPQQSDRKVGFDKLILPGPSIFPNGAKEEHYADIGESVHSFLAALPSLESASGAAQAQVAERCLVSYGLTGMLSAEELVVAGNRFRDWVIATYPDARWHTEIEVSGPKSSGGHWHGIVDLLLELPDGSVVIIDHKSAPIRREYCEAKAATFISQLDAYREILEGTGRTVAATCVHFPLAGVVVNCK